jgi:hypothetical protein
MTQTTTSTRVLWSTMGGPSKKASSRQSPRSGSLRLREKLGVASLELFEGQTLVELTSHLGSDILGQARDEVRIIERVLDGQRTLRHRREATQADRRVSDSYHVHPTGTARS